MQDGASNLLTMKFNSKESKMKFLVTDIEFDFNTDMPDYYSVSFDDQTSIINDNLGVWDAEDEDDLIEEVTSNAGWCIKSIDYEIQLKGDFT